MTAKHASANSSSAKDKLLSLPDGTVAYTHSDGTTVLMPAHVVEHEKIAASNDEGSRVYDGDRFVAFIARTLDAQTSLKHKGAVQGDMGEIIGTDCLASYEHIKKYAIKTRQVTVGPRKGCLEAEYDPQSRMEPLAEPTPFFHVEFMPPLPDGKPKHPDIDTLDRYIKESKRLLGLNSHDEVLIIHHAGPGKIPDPAGALIPRRSMDPMSKAVPPRLVWADKSPDREEIYNVRLPNQTESQDLLPDSDPAARLQVLKDGNYYGVNRVPFEELPDSPAKLKQALIHYLDAHRETTLIIEPSLDLHEKTRCFDRGLMGRGGVSSLQDELERIIRYTELRAGKIVPAFEFATGDPRIAQIASKHRGNRMDICFRINPGIDKPVPILWCEQTAFTNKSGEQLPLRKMGIYNDGLTHMSEVIANGTLQLNSQRRREDRAIIDSIQEVTSANATRGLRKGPTSDKSHTPNSKKMDTGRRLIPHRTPSAQHSSRR